MARLTFHRGVALATIGLVAVVGVRELLGRKGANTPAGAVALRDFRRRYRAALDDPQLRGNLLHYQRSWRRQRYAAFEAYQARTGRDFDTMRRELAGVKDDVIANLPGYFQQFKEAAERNGAVVYQASSAADACRYIADLAKRHDVQVVTKSKSMVSEEINLNRVLEETGLRVVETDFGEYAVHLSDYRPSHMISSIAHLNRYQVAALLTEDTGQTLSGENINDLTVAARKRLREAFLSARMGISGANALIAESGTVMLVANEGNAELTTSLPNVHIVITGYEKILPTFANAMAEGDRPDDLPGQSGSAARGRPERGPVPSGHLSLLLPVPQRPGHPRRASAANQGRHGVGSGGNGGAKARQRRRHRRTHSGHR